MESHKEKKRPHEGPHGDRVCPKGSEYVTPEEWAGSLMDRWMSIYHFTPEEAASCAEWGQKWLDKYVELLGSTPAEDLTADEINALVKKSKDISLLTSEGIPMYASKSLEAGQRQPQLRSVWAAEEYFITNFTDGLDLRKLVCKEIHGSYQVDNDYRY